MTVLNAVIEMPVPNVPVASGGTLKAPDGGDVPPAGERAGRDTLDSSAFRANPVMEYNVTQAQRIGPVCDETEANPFRIGAVRDADVSIGPELGNVSDVTDRMALNASPVLESSAIPRTLPEHVNPRRPAVANASFSSLSRDMSLWPASQMNVTGADESVPHAERTAAKPVPRTGAMLPDVIDEPVLSAAQQGLRVATGLRTPFSGPSDAVTHTSTERWGPQLMSALGERIGLHMRLGVERAIIRLDPQSMGTLQIEIRRDGGALQIQFIASHEDVARQLSEMTCELRQQLEGRQHGEVSVVVQHGPGSGQHGASPDDDADTPESETPPGKALAEADIGYAEADFHLDDRQWK
ncbi:flagellar hook-length control protein FliK [Pandoraea apista]|nr:flagellar hook-length control protein FliK [Pandoraea apista]RRW98094.1 flagellar hook-length control protein FliK [Pandoraea apista]